MTLPKCFDAALPPAYVPAGAAAVLGYIGSHHLDRDRHIWTPAEWQPFAHLRQFPAWEVNTAVSAVETAEAAVEQMHALGWHDGRALVLSMETTSAPEWWGECQAQVERLRMVPVCYGSESTVFGNHAYRYWVAEWNGEPVLEPGWDAHQYLSGGGVDWSVLSWELLRHGGEGARLL